jgi:myosin heavy subunit
MATLSAAAPFFVRCLKPNMEKIADNFKDDVVLNQLRYSGTVEQPCSVIASLSHFAAWAFRST